MKIAILGFGLQGRSAYEYWREGNEITICDKSSDTEVPQDAASQLGESYLQRLEHFDLIVRSPSVHPNDIVGASSPEILKKVTTVTNEFFKVCPSKNIIGVTGTKGKGTTSTLIAKILEADGRRVHLGGNVGTPPLDMLKDNIDANDWVVLELANFQLIDLKYSPHIAVCLMVVPEHLDWHADTAEYFTAKQLLFERQTTDDYAIFYAENETSRKIASVGEGHKIPYFAAPGAEVKDNMVTVDGRNICDISELKLLGRHNWQNVCAAVTAVWQVSQNTDVMRKVLSTFSGLPFRIELRREVAGIRYYNDSFATGPGATIAAVHAIPGPKVMIIGGYERGLDLSELAGTLAGTRAEIRKVLLIGDSAKRVSEELDRAGFKNYMLSEGKDMASIVKEATGLAKDGDAVVLSPAFASFDMFKNFEQRGRKFNESIETL